MIRFFCKPGRWAMVFSLMLTLATAFLLLDTFVIPKAYAQTVPATAAEPQSDASADTLPESTAGESAALSCPHTAKPP